MNQGMKYRWKINFTKVFVRRYREFKTAEFYSLHFHAKICQINDISIRPNTEYSADVAEYAEYQKLRENGRKTPKFREDWLKMREKKFYFYVKSFLISRELSESFI